MEQPDREAARYINSRHPKLRDSHPVIHEQSNRVHRGEKEHREPADRIVDWLKVLNRIYDFEKRSKKKHR